MDSHFLSQDLKSELKTSLTAVSTLLQQLNLVDRNNPASVQAFESLQALIGNNTPTVQTEIDNFTFTEPAQSFTDFLAELKTVKPRYGEHIIERNGVTFATADRKAMLTQTRLSLVGQPGISFLERNSKQQKLICKGHMTRLTSKPKETTEPHRELSRNGRFSGAIPQTTVARKTVSCNSPI
jgi:hypothetical protein